ncbi:monocarboxylate transporter 12 [Galendromus occidentalis]|uniref:Monocarboxylate transporter 12 n=1 Tax=Galendromus occidentalis TaxID=34638 RepID=A0AAJ6QVQ1_9ACAR|nr:monocarboxylate transporter 12 [Galendromus occidentalis]
MAVKLDSVSSWILAISVSALFTSSILVFRCASILFIGIYERFGVSREEAAWPITAYFVSTCFSGPIVGLLSQRIETRKLFLFSACFNSFAVILSSFSTKIWHLSLTLGVLLGFSAGIPVTLSGVLVTQYFDRYRVAAVGVLMAGPSILSIVAPSVLQLCIDTYQLSGALLLSAGLCMQGIPASLLLLTIDKPEALQPLPAESADVKVPLTEKSSKEQIDADPTGKNIPLVVLRQLGGNRVRRDTPRLTIEDNESAVPSSMYKVDKKGSIVRLFRMKWFYIMALPHMAFGLTLSTLLNLIEDYGRDKNVDPVIARNLVGVFAGTDLLARLGSSWITDGGFIAREHFFILNFLMKAASLVLLALTSNSIALLCTVGCLGWLFGTTMILFIDIMRDRLGLELLAFANGMYLFLGGLLGLSLPRAIGFFREQSGSYNPIMYILAGLTATASLVYLTGCSLGREKSLPGMHLSQELPDPEEALDSGRFRSASSTLSVQRL